MFEEIDQLDDGKGAVAPMCHYPDHRFLRVGPCGRQRGVIALWGRGRTCLDPRGQFADWWSTA
jgi:hypothetical protein